MRVVLSVILSLIILSQSFYKAGWVAYYNIYQDYIVDVFCINKSKPKMACGGKCYLMKQLKEDEKQELPAPASEKEEGQNFYTSPNGIQPPCYITMGKQRFPLWDDHRMSSGYALRIFRPPIV